MAVSENDLVVGPLTPAAGVTTISLDFYFEQASWLEVYRSGSETPLVLNTDYTVTGAGSSSGVVTLAAPANGTDVYSVYLVVPLQRSSDMQLRGEFKSEPFNIEMDRVWQALQGLRARVSRTLRVSHTSTAPGALFSEDTSARAGRVIAFDENGTSLDIGPSADEIASAQGYAEAAMASEVSASNSANSAKLSAAAVSVQRVQFKTIAAMKASGALSYVGGGGTYEVAAGDVVMAAGHRYEVKAAGTAFGGNSGYHISTSDGVLLRLLVDSAGHYNFGAIAHGDGATDDYALLNALLSVDTVGVANAWYQSIPPIYLPPADYYISQTLELKKSVRLFGDDSGLPSTSTARLIFPTDTLGIVVNRYNTLNGGVEVTPTTAADGTVLQGFRMKSTCGSDKTKHGIWLRARAAVIGVNIEGFSGNGVNLVATAGGTSDIEGNANNFLLQTMRITGNGGHGVYVDGADVNAGTAISIDCSYNGRSGIFDSSFLGNTYIGCHVASNGGAGAGANAATESAFVSYGGNRYAAHPDATEAQLVATTPGTDASVWALAGAGGTHPTIPAWTASQPEGTYFHAYGYHCDNANARNVFLGCYWESGSSGNVFDGPCQVLGGSIGWVIVGDFMRKTIGGGTLFNSVHIDDNTIEAALGGNAGNGDVLSWAHVDDTAAWPWRFRRNGADFQMDNANGAGGRLAMVLHGENTTKQCGTSETKPYILSFPTLGVGPGNNIRRQTTGSAAPTSGAWAQGDIVWNIGASAGGKVGWVCTTAGSPGTWKPFGAIDA